ncbi:MAG: histidine kinase dimerization/phospho-acceptor domain-containing protein [Kangiellaceae bacterium]|nr:histidine kinase dimerization/phospho-acceptor domain-containing protein [Kangiellaceae bacterium]
MNQFLRFCSHEFKTPTNSLIAFLDIARNRSDLDLELKESLNIAYISSKQILYLATNLIDYSCLIAEQFTVNKNDAQLTDVLSECEFMITMLA